MPVSGRYLINVSTCALQELIAGSTWAVWTQMQRFRVRSTWMYRCWKIHGAVVYAVMCSRPGMVRMEDSVGLVWEWTRVHWILLVVLAFETTSLLGYFWAHSQDPLQANSPSSPGLQVPGVRAQAKSLGPQWPAAKGQTLRMAWKCVEVY